MKKIKLYIKKSNILIIKILLSMVFFMIIIPYHFFIKRPNQTWINHDNEQFPDLRYMW